jgi:hypothetical protein
MRAFIALAAAPAILEFLNAFNRVVFSNRNTGPTRAEFAKARRQNKLPRDIQLAVKLLF